MILQRIANLNVFHKVKQLESIIKPSCMVSQYGQLSQTTRFSACLANFNTSSPNLVNNENRRLLTKLPITTTFGNGNQCRFASTDGDHVRLWLIERIVSAALPILLPASFMVESAAIDVAVAVLVVMHMHWGLEALIYDYARPIVVGPIVPKLCHLLLNLLSIMTLAGLLVLVYNGPGIAKVIKDGWVTNKNNN